MSAYRDGPTTSLFSPIKLTGQAKISALSQQGISPEMIAAAPDAPSGSCVGWGIPFEIGNVIALVDEDVSIDVDPIQARWLVFMHTSDIRQVAHNAFGFFSPMRGQGQLGELAASYVIRYSDGEELSLPIRRRFQIGAFRRRWGENCFEAVAHHKPRPVRASHEQTSPIWGASQTRVDVFDAGIWTNWLWAWENPHPHKAISGFRFEPATGGLILAAISAGEAESLPLRWEPRHKALLTLPQGETFKPELSEDGLLQQIQLDMGQVISATLRPLYPNDRWSQTDNNLQPLISENEVLIEYSAHPQACFHLSDGRSIPVEQIAQGRDTAPIQPVSAQTRRVALRVVESGSGKVVPVKLHVHGEWGEMLVPLDRHRIPNPAWFEDYSVDFVHGGSWDGSLKNPHHCTYIPGETPIDLPFGKVYLEVSKGFEIKPVRKVIDVAPDTEEIVIEIEKVLPWREKGWVTADTHVHFLSPMSAMLEGSAEGVNVVNLLASQWGELMTNVGDFDGRTTWGSREAGGDGEYLVRVGTENRQHVLGHISLLGYNGQIIVPMTTGGPDESALGDPIEVLLTEWARQCRKQGGIVVLPHFPQPRGEHAASVVSGVIDALEMTSWGDLYNGIDPYSLSDWYRYLNCGYLVAAVGGTDKMSANTAVGTVRTYARLNSHAEFSYESWKEAVRQAETFVTYGPLLELSVDGHPMGSHIHMTSSGGTVDVEWEAVSVTIPISRVELIVNGEIRESLGLPAEGGRGHWSFKVERSSWIALLVRGHYADKPEIIAAHSTPVIVTLEGSPMLPAADAVTILEQIEGAMAYLDTVGTRADERTYKRMRLVLQSAHRTMHNRMHQLGYFHEHTPLTEHA